MRSLKPCTFEIWGLVDLVLGRASHPWRPVNPAGLCWALAVLCGLRRFFFFFFFFPFLGLSKLLPKTRNFLKSQSNETFSFQKSLTPQVSLFLG